MLKKSSEKRKDITIYQSKSGAIAFRGDVEAETIWGNLNQIADLFGRDKSVISRHIRNIYKSGELEQKGTVAKIATVQTEGKREVLREREYYNLDVILSVGYRVDSKEATQFRKWATKTLKQHLIQGYTINKKKIGQHYEQFMQALAEVKALLPNKNRIETSDVLDLVSVFASTWFSLDAYDKATFPTGQSQKSIQLEAGELFNALLVLKQKLVARDQATELFAQEKKKGNLEGIVGNIFQTAFGKDVYPTLEGKAAHLLYFMVKNHPFTDGNKRSAAFAFVWFLRKAGILRASLTPEALTALTLLIAESNPKDKEKMVGLVLLLLQR